MREPCRSHCLLLICRVYRLISASTIPTPWAISIGYVAVGCPSAAQSAVWRTDSIHSPWIAAVAHIIDIAIGSGEEGGGTGETTIKAVVGACLAVNGQTQEKDGG